MTDGGPARPSERGRDRRLAGPVAGRGVRQGRPDPSPGVDALLADGFRTVFDVEPVDADRDPYQDHLNNTAAVRMFNELRIAYVATRLAPRWPSTCGARASRSWSASCTCCTRARVGCTSASSARRGSSAARGKAGILEQRLVEATTARPVARAWIVQLLVAVEGVVDWPEWYWEMVAGVEGAPVPIRRRVGPAAVGTARVSGGGVSDPPPDPRAAIVGWLDMQADRLPGLGSQFYGRPV